MSATDEPGRVPGRAAGGRAAGGRAAGSREAGGRAAGSREAGGRAAGARAAGGRPGVDGQPAAFVSTPNAERYLLEADNLRRRQLRSALLHGSGRTWRDRRRIWPAVVAGIVVVAVIAAALAIAGTFQSEQRRRQQQEQERIEQQQRIEAPRPTETVGASPAPGSEPP